MSDKGARLPTKQQCSIVNISFEERTMMIDVSMRGVGSHNSVIANRRARPERGTIRQGTR